ncbi:MAG: cysteine--tRNA ligase [Clostridiales bacterium]|jgi:cysteinyl-tRNA synthetase|nr:cysteine--tRNA ligase [Clostridiales bacterium]
MKLYNTLTRKKENFEPINGATVTLYSCGPTVYNYAHIGNMRTYIFMDLLRRALKFNGYKLKGVMNITDVGHLLSDGDEGEDKLDKAAREQKKSPYEIAEFYTRAFMSDVEKLNIGRPELVVKATDHITDMLGFVVKLCEKGYGYETSDGVYFDISKFPEYGKLSGVDLGGQQAGARVEVNPEKRNAADFALWKKAAPGHIMQWDSPWGKGYPGWHIECSAMSRKYLGVPFDIHTGGVDHIPIHHENEIAQSEALEGGKTVNFWMHGEFMMFGNGKMSKSLGNVYTVPDLEKMGYSPLDFRYFCLNAHYRKKINFTFEGLNAAKTALGNLRAALVAHKNAAAQAGGSESAREKAGGGPDLSGYKKQFADAVNDDLNIPYALGVLWTMVKEPKHPAVYAAALEMDKIFGLSLDVVPAAGPKPEPAAAPAAVIELAEKRKQARMNRDYKASDVLRAEIEAAGFTVTDKLGNEYEIKAKVES